MSGVPARYRANPGERLHPRLVDNGGCREWTGSRNEDGYGVMTVNGRRVKAHRFAWELRHGPIPDGMDVLHRCDNPPCCNADDCLYLGDEVQNAADRRDRGRHGMTLHPERAARGEAHGCAVLTDADVIAIRKRRTESASLLAREFGVSRATVRAVLSGKTWRHL